ncbi:uncharacterized protein Dvir_GJ26432, partial [Drosophila virilis]
MEHNANKSGKPSEEWLNRDPGIVQVQSEDINRVHNEAKRLGYVPANMAAAGVTNTSAGENVKRTTERSEIQGDISDETILTCESATSAFSETALSHMFCDSDEDTNWTNAIVGIERRAVGAATTTTGSTCQQVQQQQQTPILAAEVPLNDPPFLPESTGAATTTSTRTTTSANVIANLEGDAQKLAPTLSECATGTTSGRLRDAAKVTMAAKINGAKCRVTMPMKQQRKPIVRLYNIARPKNNLAKNAMPGGEEGNMNMDIDANTSSDGYSEVIISDDEATEQQIGGKQVASEVQEAQPQLGQTRKLILEPFIPVRLLRPRYTEQLDRCMAPLRQQQLTQQREVAEERLPTLLQLEEDEQEAERRAAMLAEWEQRRAMGPPKRFDECTINMLRRKLKAGTITRENLMLLIDNQPPQIQWLILPELQHEHLQRQHQELIRTAEPAPGAIIQSAIDTDELQLERSLDMLEQALGQEMDEALIIAGNNIHIEMQQRLADNESVQLNTNELQMQHGQRLCGSSTNNTNATNTNN